MIFQFIIFSPYLAHSNGELLRLTFPTFKLVEKFDQVIFAEAEQKVLDFLLDFVCTGESFSPYSTIEAAHYSEPNKTQNVRITIV